MYDMIESARTVTVVVPSYRRPEQLAACLRGIARQDRPPDEVVVVRREGDSATAAVIKSEPLSVKEITVKVPGQSFALRAGVAGASGGIVAFVDDDAIPRFDWLARILVSFQDRSVGGVGGRDVVHQNGGIEIGEARDVGRLTWWGRAVGNHHIGIGSPRRVDILKGCNCAYRRDVIGLPVGLRGSGAEVANDMATSLFVRSRGLELIYDPEIVVDHFPGVRFDADGRNQPSRRAELDAVYNVSYAICSTNPSIRGRFRLYHLLVGHRMIPGALRTLVGKWKQERLSFEGYLSVQRTVREATRDAHRHPLEFWTPSNTLQ
jgi:glycosyltransferase involved in cell wall biosynthesis